jgi:hypothetical protein
MRIFHSLWLFHFFLRGVMDYILSSFDHVTIFLSIPGGNSLHLYSIFLGSPVEIRVVGMMERCNCG